MELIYHKNENKFSPFDRAITEIIENKDIKIVCPYIGIKYMERIINFSKSWLLITDIEELIWSHDIEHRETVKKFLFENNHKIHHCRDIHAKVVISDDKIFLGSSNLTNKGITKRIEMSVVISEVDNVKELNNWFDGLWSETDFVENKDIEQYIKSISNISQIGSKNYKGIIESKLQGKKFNLIENTKIEINLENMSKDTPNINNQNSMNTGFDFIKENISNQNIIRNYIKEELDKIGFKPDIRQDTNIPIKIGSKKSCYIDFKYEYKEFGHPVARFCKFLKLNDPRIIKYVKNISGFKRSRDWMDGKPDYEKINIGIKCDSDFELVKKACISLRDNE